MGRSMIDLSNLEIVSSNILQLKAQYILAAPAVAPAVTPTVAPAVAPAPTEDDVMEEPQEIETQTLAPTVRSPVTPPALILILKQLIWL